MSSTRTSALCKQFVVQFITVVALLLVTSLSLFGQTIPTGSLAGSVTDSQGAVVPNATVVVKNLATNREYTVQSSDNGTFTVPSLDRKSTRLNSSHSQISYAVFCLK